MKINVNNVGKGQDTKSVIDWVFDSNSIQIEFNCIARPLYSKKINKVFVSVYFENAIFVFRSEDGDLEEKFAIPKKENYQYRGLSINPKSRSGVALLFAPTSDQAGNEWSDIEQYELVMEPYILGEYLAIYR